MDREKVIITSCPVVFTYKAAKIARIVSIDDIEQANHILRFERDIHWLRQATLYTQLRVNDKLVNDITTLTDYYGYLTCADSVASDCTSYAEQYEITEKSDASIVATLHITDTPVLNAPSWARQQYAPANKQQFINVPRDWMLDGERVDRWNNATMEERLNDLVVMPDFLYDTVTVARVRIWDSKWSHESRKNVHNLVAQYRV